MPPKIVFSPDANQDMDDILSYYIAVADQATAYSMVAKIATAITQLAENPLLSGTRVGDPKKNRRKRGILKGEYWVYFTRYKTISGLRVLRVYSARRKGLDENQM